VPNSLINSRNYLCDLPPWRRLREFGVGDKECVLTFHKEPTVLALKGANVSLYCPVKGEKVLVV
jgi:hypothetical protein